MNDQTVQSKVFEQHLFAVLGSLDSAGMEDIVNGILALARSYPDWARNEYTSKCISGLARKWTNLPNEAEVEVTESDIADAKCLLFTLPCDLKVTDAKTADIQSLGYAAELRFAAVSLAAARFKSQRMKKLLRIELQNSALLDAVFNESVWVTTNVEVYSNGLFSYHDRKWVELVVDLLQRRLNEFPVHDMLTESDEVSPLVRLRYALLCALSREVSRANKPKN